MKITNKYFALRKLTLIVQSALIAMAATPLATFAADDEAAALVQPSNSVEVGVKVMPKDSAKFGEYNGVDKSGAYLIGNFNLRGGNAYNAYEGGSGVNRWDAYGIDLGTTSRELGGSVSNQGQWNVGIKYEELRHNISDTYQTPLQGGMGGNNLTMPAAFGVINSSLAGPGTSNIGTGAQVLTQTQINLFHKVDIYTDRKNSNLTAGYIFDDQWSIKFDYNHLNQTGAKLMMASSDFSAAGNGPISPVLGVNKSTWYREQMLMIMNPTNYTTDTFNLGVNWKGDKSFLTVGYYGSLFRDDYNGLTFPNVFAVAVSPATLPTGTLSANGFPTSTISTAPSNDFHQVNLSGGYTLTPTTKLAGGFSFARNTQNESYTPAVMQGGITPQGSLNGLVETVNANFKLTNQTSKDLVLSAGLKFNERDNKSASNTYKFIDIAGGTPTAISTPMSNSKTQLELAGDYRIDLKNRLRLAYEYEGVSRWCNNALANSLGSCVQVPSSDESKLVVGYKLNASEAVNFNAGYSYAKRNSDVNSNFYNPMQANTQGFELAGYRAFFDASRREQVVKAGANWQLNEKIGLGLNSRYTDDKYTDSPLGVKNGNAWSVNLDATYNYMENGTVTAYVTQERRQRDLTNQQRLSTSVTTATSSVLAPVLIGSTWSNSLDDDNFIVGLGLKQGGLMHGKLTIAGDMSYSVGTTGYTTNLNYNAATSGGLTCASPQFLTCGSTPDIKNRLLNVKVMGNYQIDKANKVALSYMFQKLESNDYYYNFYQTGYVGTGNLPTNEQSPSYAVNVVSATYIYTF
jgi:MtrB/PioB family decaheme-associated outer membrane protein